MTPLKSAHEPPAQSLAYLAPATAGAFFLYQISASKSFQEYWRYL